MDTTMKVVTELSTVHVVCKFLDVFPEESLGLPLDREIEFEIELLPGIVQIQSTLSNGSRRVERVKVAVARITG